MTGLKSITCPVPQKLGRVGLAMSFDCCNPLPKLGLAKNWKNFYLHIADLDMQEEHILVVSPKYSENPHSAIFDSVANSPSTTTSVSFISSRSTSTSEMNVSLPQTGF